MHHIFGQKHPFYTYENALFPPLSPKGPQRDCDALKKHLEERTLQKAQEHRGRDFSI